MITLSIIGVDNTGYRLLQLTKSCIVSTKTVIS